MIFYFAGVSPQFYKGLKDLGIQHVLKAYIESLPLRPIDHGFKLFLDSGAFSAFTLGKYISVEEYGKFLLKNKDKIYIYANLDDIKSPEQTLANQTYLEGLGLEPLPTFHVGEDFELLKEFSKKYDYIALGGMVPHIKNKPYLEKWLTNVFSITKDEIKTHAFGIKTLSFLTKFPFYSCDSTSWLAGTKFGTVINFSGLRVENFHYKDEKALNKFKGDTFDFYETKNRDSQYINRVIHNAKVYLEIQKFVTQLWEERGVKWE